MSPVLFALALDPFLDYLCRQLPQGDIVRAYADDMAVVLHCVQTIDIIAPCFDLLHHASGLQVNIQKTILVPLHETTVMQTRRNIQHLAWKNVEIHIGHSKYLGFQVGPFANAENNFQEAMTKFRKRALYWLGLRNLGAYFQCFGFNMCCVSVLAFVAQLYIIPDHLAQECKRMALRFMHGPGVWLHGEGGHAFFQAEKQLGLKACPHSPEAYCLACTFQGTSKFVSDYKLMISRLADVSCSGPIPVRRCWEVIRFSAASQSKQVHDRADELRYKELCAKAPIRTKVHHIAYHMFLDHLHPTSACYYRVLDAYHNRWCKDIFVGGNEQYLAHTACLNLKWLSTQVPARVHLANVRLHLNGWHTERRYQRNSVCRFCEIADSEDSIEHFVRCSWVSSFFPRSLQVEAPGRISHALLFLFGVGESEKIAISIFNFGLYTVCNELRHSNNKRDLKLTLKRIMGEIYMRPAVLQAWERFFGYPLEHRRRQSS